MDPLFCVRASSSQNPWKAHIYCFSLEGNSALTPMSEAISLLSVMSATQQSVGLGRDGKSDGGFGGDLEARGTLEAGAL